MHVVFLIECDNGKSASGHLLTGTEVVFGLFQFDWGSKAPAECPAIAWQARFRAYTSVNKTAKSCEAFGPVWKKMAAWDKSPPVYWTGVQDCYWYVDTLMNIGDTAGY